MTCKRIVLLYGFTSVRVKLIKAALSALGCGVRDVEKREYSLPVGGLAGLSGIKSEGGSGNIDGEFMVICGYSGAGLDVVLDALKMSGVGRETLKAVLTETNASWSGPKLYNEVRAEHEAMNRG